MRLVFQKYKNVNALAQVFSACINTHTHTRRNTTETKLYIPFCCGRNGRNARPLGASTRQRLRRLFSTARGEHDRSSSNSSRATPDENSQTVGYTLYYTQQQLSIIIFTQVTQLDASEQRKKKKIFIILFLFRVGDSS